MKKVTKREARIKAGRMMIEQLRSRETPLELRLKLVQLVVPVGLVWAEQEMQAERDGLIGARYVRGKDIGPWGSNPGSVYLGDQKVSALIPRVRNRQTNREIPLESYQRLQQPGVVDEMALQRVLKGISQRQYEEAAIRVPATFGIKRNSVSKRFIKASGRKLRAFLERDLKSYDFVALILDGKTYAKTQIVVALGVTMKGEKILLGFTEASTENHVICKEFLNRLVNRGLRTDQEILVVLDGAKGLRKGVLEVFGNMAFIQRCQWHKRENVIRHLDRDNQDYFRRKLQAAYEQPTYEKAKERLAVIRRELMPINECAVESLEEGQEETLTLHKLKMFTKVGISLKTTNCLENVNKHLGRYTWKVAYWRNSDQKRRWIGAALSEIEPKLRLIKGREFLPTLRDMMRDFRFKTTFKHYLKAA
jgi:transposase-like protein